MKLIHDFFCLAIDKRYEDDVRKSGIVPFTAAMLRDSQEDEEQRDDLHWRKKRIYGEIVECPDSYSDTIVDLIDEGTPGYKLYVSGDYRGSMIEAGFDPKWGVPEYYPSTKEKYEQTTRFDLGQISQVKKGDKVYFDYKVTEPEHEIGTYKGMPLYKLPIEHIHCIVRKRRSKIDGRMKTDIIMQNYWVLVEPKRETWEDITTPSGIIMKKHPENKQLQGIVRHAMPDSGLKNGDHIIYEPMADFTMFVEGREYYCMKQLEVLMKERV